MEEELFLTPEQVWDIRKTFGTPVYVYDEKTLERNARTVLAFPSPFGLRVRYAMKALSTASILRLFDGAGLHIDASSGWEAERAMTAGIDAVKIQITAQQLPDNLEALVNKGVLFNACSLNQLRAYGRLFPGREVSVRMNPGLGSGHNNRTNVGGPSSSFGIWHECLDEVLGIQEEFNLKITRLHTHVGSGGDPEVWKRCAGLTLDMAAKFPDVHTVNLGGGFKVGRMPGEESADVQTVGKAISRELEAFREDHGRELELELEPGTYLIANVGAIVCSVIDIVRTGAKGYEFIKIDSGMTEILRPAMYGAQHPLYVIPPVGQSRGKGTYLVAGHCCESGDILTPEEGNPEGLEPRELGEAKVGDCFVIGDTGAYCSAQAAKNYNSFPQAPEVLVTTEGEYKLIRRRQSLEEMVANEVV